VKSDEVAISERLSDVEARLRRLEGSLARRVVVVDGDHLRSVGDAVDQFLALSEELRGRWGGDLSAVDEVRAMRKGKRGR